ncbi:MAG: Transcriptional regulator, LysR family [Gammaproteobacteria bacterium]|nr:Transcriptional regulator, LysR family [Gammaproteobacteria bacterium]
MAIQDLNDLYFFTLVVDKGSFTAASQSIGITKSRISRRIALLEAQLGVRLLHRSTRRLMLTNIGQIFYQHCRAMVNEAQAAQQAAEQAQLKPRGRIRVTCPALFAQTSLGFFIIHFMKTYPEVQISLTATDRRVDLIAEGFDVAIRFQADRLEDSNLVVRSLGESALYLVASPELLNKTGYPKIPSELNAITSLAKTRSDGLYSWHFTKKDGVKCNLAYNPVLESNEWTVLKQAALEGLGITALPGEICKQEIQQGQLQRLLTDWSLPGAKLYIVYPSRRGLVPAVNYFIEFIASQLANSCSQIAH